MGKPKGQGFCIGLNTVDPNHYQGWSGPLNACEADAHDMEAIAAAEGYEVKKLLTKQATRKAVLDSIASAAQTLKSDDFFFLTYSGHGGQLPDHNGDELDGQDETWCLYDGQLVDDQIYHALSAFPSGVRILLFSDSCHSGTVAKAQKLAAASPMRGGNGTGQAPSIYRAAPDEVCLRTYRANKAEYDKVLTDSRYKNAMKNIKASVLLISGCQDSQLSLDGTFNGLFTGTLLRVWNGGTFKGDHRKFHKQIQSRMPENQTPNYFWAGQPDLAFESLRPLTLKAL